MLWVVVFLLLPVQAETLDSKKSKFYSNEWPSGPLWKEWYDTYVALAAKRNTVKAEVKPDLTEVRDGIFSENQAKQQKWWDEGYNETLALDTSARANLENAANKVALHASNRLDQAIIIDTEVPDTMKAIVAKNYQLEKDRDAEIAEVKTTTNDIATTAQDDVKAWRAKELKTVDETGESWLGGHGIPLIKEDLMMATQVAQEDERAMNGKFSEDWKENKERFSGTWDKLDELADSSDGLGTLMRVAAKRTLDLVNRMRQGALVLNQRERELRGEKDNTINKMGENEGQYIKELLHELDTTNAFQVESNSKVGSADRAIASAERAVQGGWKSAVTVGKKAAQGLVGRAQRVKATGNNLISKAKGLSNFATVGADATAELKEQVETLPTVFAKKEDEARKLMTTGFNNKIKERMRKTSSRMNTMYVNSCQQYKEDLSELVKSAEDKMSMLKEEAGTQTRKLAERSMAAITFGTNVESDASSQLRIAESMKGIMNPIESGVEGSLESRMTGFEMDELGELKQVKAKAQEAGVKAKDDADEAVQEVKDQTYELQASIRDQVKKLIQISREGTETIKDHLKDNDDAAHSEINMLLQEVSGLKTMLVNVMSNVIPKMSRGVEQSVLSYLDQISKDSAAIQVNHEKVSEMMNNTVDDVNARLKKEVDKVTSEVDDDIDGRRTEVNTLRSSTDADIRKFVSSSKEALSRPRKEATKQSSSYNTQKSKWRTKNQQQDMALKSAQEAAQELLDSTGRSRQENLDALSRSHRMLNQRVAKNVRAPETDFPKTVEQTVEALKATGDTGVENIKDSLHALSKVNQNVRGYLTDFHTTLHNVKNGMDVRDIAMSSMGQELFSHVESAEKDLSTGSILEQESVSAQKAHLLARTKELQSRLGKKKKEFGDELHASMSTAVNDAHGKMEDIINDQSLNIKEREEALRAAEKNMITEMDNLENEAGNTNSEANQVTSDGQSAGKTFAKELTTASGDVLGDTTAQANAANGAGGSSNKVIGVAITEAGKILPFLNKAQSGINNHVNHAEERWQDGLKVAAHAKTQAVETQQFAQQKLAAEMAAAQKEADQLLLPAEKRNSEIVNELKTQKMVSEETMHKLESKLAVEATELSDSTDAIQHKMVQRGVLISGDILNNAEALTTHVNELGEKDAALEANSDEKEKQLDLAMRVEVGGEEGEAEAAILDAKKLKMEHHELHMWAAGHDASHRAFRRIVEGKLTKMGGDLTGFEQHIGVSAHQSESALRGAGNSLEDEIGAEQGEESAEANAELAALFDEADAEIARLEADTSLTEEERKAAIAKIRADADSRAAAIRAKQEQLKADERDVELKVGKFAGDLEKTMAALDAKAGGAAGSDDLREKMMNMATTVHAMSLHKLAQPSLLEKKEKQGADSTSKVAALDAMNAKLEDEDDALEQRVEQLRKVVLDKVMR